MSIEVSLNNYLLSAKKEFMEQKHAARQSGPIRLLMTDDHLLKRVIEVLEEASSASWS